MIRQILGGTGNWKPHTGSIRFLFYSNFGDAFIGWHGDSSGTSFWTPLRNQLAVCLPNAGDDTACRSELAFRTTGHGWSGNAKAYEFDQSANIDTKVYIRDPEEVTHMTVDCLASGSCKYLNVTGDKNPVIHSARSTGDWVLFVWPSKPWL